MGGATAGPARVSRGRADAWKVRRAMGVERRVDGRLEARSAGATRREAIVDEREGLWRDRRGGEGTADNEHDWHNDCGDSSKRRCRQRETGAKQNIDALFVLAFKIGRPLGIVLPETGNFLFLAVARTLLPVSAM